MKSGNSRDRRKLSTITTMVLIWLIGGAMALAMDGPSGNQSARPMQVNEILKLRQRVEELEQRLANAERSATLYRQLAGIKPEMRMLVVNSAEVNDEHLQIIGSLTELETLVLTGTQITDRGLEHLKGLRNLKMLNLSGLSGRVTGSGFKHLSELHNLETIKLSGTKIQDDTLGPLTGLKKLRTLSLGTQELGPKNYWHVTKIKSLEYLEGGTYQDDKTMFDALPNLKLIYSP
jgi:hypothetical protein